MAPNGNPSTLSLPEPLRRQLAQVSRRLWLRETAAAVCAATGGLVVSYLALFVSDRRWDTPIGWRLGFAAVAGLGVLLAAAWWARRWLIHRRDQRALAVHVQQYHRRLGDRLLGVVELAEEAIRPAYFSPALYRAAIDQVATEAAAYDFRQTVNLRPVRYGGLVLAGLLGLGVLPVLLVPATGWNAFRRWIMPIAAIPRITLVELDARPARRIVPHGEPFDLACAVRYRSFWQPTRAFCRYQDQDWIEAPVQHGQVRFHLPGQAQVGTLRIWLGDARQQVEIQPTYRPTLRELSATIELPKYLGYSPVETGIQNGVLPVLEGSRVTFHGRATRALAAAAIRPDDQQPQPLSIQGDTFSSPALDLDAVSACVFTWRDQLGLETGVPWRLNLQRQKDAPPEPELPGLQPETALLVTDVLEVKVAAHDDFGVRDLGLNWQRAADAQSTNSAAVQTFRVPAESHQQRELDQAFEFSPALMNIPPDST
ncbi:MAG: hypothetical protein KGS61_14420, partial [Verrucomicrobia bacterium]|nr:hypothetical protein [Verrucomicrobiota bacterium]